MKTNILPKYFLSAAIGLLPTYAMAQPKKPETAPAVHGSDATLKPLARIMGSFKKLAGMDVIVVSPDDLLSDKEKRLLNIFSYVGVERTMSIGEKEISKRMKNVMQRHEHLFQDAKENNYATDDYMHALWSGLIVNESPFSMTLPIEETGKKVCFIGAYDDKTGARKMLASLAGLPAFMAEGIQTNIPADILHAFIMLHEAQHCVQDKSAERGTPEKSVEVLKNELDADRQAFQELRKIYKKTPKTVERAISEIKLARALATLRGAHGAQLGQESHLSHGGFLSDKDEKNPRDAADVILASGLANMGHHITGLVFAMAATTSSDPRITSYVQDYNARVKDYRSNSPMLAFDDPYAFGKHIAHNFPMVEYAQYKMFHELLLNKSMDKELEGLRKHSSFQTLETIIGNYVKAFEKLIPGAVTHPLVKDYHLMLEDGYKEIKRNLDEKQKETPDAKPLPPYTFPFTSLDGLKMFEQLRVKMETERMERELKLAEEHRKIEEEYRKRRKSGLPWFSPSPKQPKTLDMP